MQVKHKQDGSFLKDLGGDLVMRRATPEDADQLAEFNAVIHRDAESDPPDEYVRVWTRDLLTRPHPTFKPGDSTVVEETRTGRIVSSLSLISQTWSYGGIRLGVGRTELVGTHPDYRRRGLVRAQFDEIHRWSAQRGELLQAITGIPYYYRLFGYEMAVQLGGGRSGYKAQVPRLKGDEQEPYRVCPADEADIPFISELYDRACNRYLLNAVWSDAMWRYELTGKSEKNVNRMEVRILETQEGEPVGYLAHAHRLWGPVLTAVAYELKPGTSFAEVTPSVIRYLYDTGKRIAQEQNKEDEFDGFGFHLGVEHPAYAVMRDRLVRTQRPYAWYVRVPDLPKFLRRIAPVLQARLVTSPVSGQSGEYKLSFYRDGLRLVLKKGRLAEIEAWKPAPQGHSGEAAFPGLSFLQLLLGYRSFDELDAAYPDCWAANDTSYAVLNALYPKQPSDIWPIA